MFKAVSSYSLQKDIQYSILFYSILLKIGKLKNIGVKREHTQNTFLL